ncbi:MAG: hypothetical protein IJG13_02525 [Kiritimatiellae bacterium]|nr:hypothetical protein [Kiritimatiellia bacterium]MBQ3342218.1 hypothetical protein [Kiritimatiellia bacterium]
MTKRIVHYAVLAAALLGVPLACCMLGGHSELLEGVKSFPPRTEDWGFHPELLWNHRRPFSWWAFSGLMAFTALCLFPFARRLLRFAVSRGRAFGLPFSVPSRGRFPWWGWLGAAVLAAGWVLSWNYRFGWLPHPPARVQVQLSYAPVWAGFILLVNALCVKRSGHSPMTDHPWAYAATFPASSLFWWFFEYLNRYVWNWYYLGIAEIGAVEYVVYASVCFASVLPGVCAVAALLHTFPAFDDRVFSGMACVDLRRPKWCVFLGVLAATGLCGIVFAPEFAYPLLWISPVAVFLLLQFLMKEPCVLDPVTRGNWSVFIRFAVAALVCGFCWETWNYYALAKWVYAVPWVQRFQIWEMPLVGFAGYLPFGVECAAVTAWILPDLVEPRRSAGDH